MLAENRDFVSLLERYLQQLGYGSSDYVDFIIEALECGILDNELVRSLMASDPKKPRPGILCDYEVRFLINLATSSSPEFIYTLTNIHTKIQNTKRFREERDVRKEK